MGRIFIGTSGFSYPHWGKGVFYPRHLKPHVWLAYYSHYFDTVEINSSFYRLPTEETLNRSYEQRKRQKLFAEIAKLMTELGLHTIDLPSLVGGFLWLSDMMNDAQTRIQMKQKGEEYLSKSH